VPKKREYIELRVTIQAEEINKLKTDEDIEDLFLEKMGTALHNLKIDIKKLIKEKKRCLSKEPSPRSSTTPVFLPSSYVAESITSG